MLRACHRLWLLAGAFLVLAAWMRPFRLSGWVRRGVHELMLPLAIAALVRCWMRLWCFPEPPAVRAEWVQVPATVLDGDEPPDAAVLSAMLRTRVGQAAYQEWQAAHAASAQQREQPKGPPSKVAERTLQLNERTRVCSRLEWEEEYLPRLFGVGREQGSLDQCCLCMSDMAMSDQVRGLACGHAFHLHCVAEWFMRDPTFELSCPLCRMTLSEQKTIE